MWALEDRSAIQSSALVATPWHPKIRYLSETVGTHLGQKGMYLGLRGNIQGRK